MADDDEVTDEMDDELEADTAEIAEDADPEELEPEDLEEADLDEEFGADDEFGAAAEEEEDEDDDEAAPEAPLRRATTEDDDEDDDLTTPDDVEADLDTILKDRLVSAEEAAGEDDEDDEPEDRTEPGDRLQPKRADEQLCPNCFLLVRDSAPGCPVGADDDCPIFV